MAKIYLRAGHGGRYSGAVGNGLVEKQETLRHILMLAEELSKYEGLELKLARTADVTVELNDSIAEANRWGADLYYSSHINGFQDSSAYGYESHIYPTPLAESIRVQNVLHPKQAAVWVKWGSRDRGKKRSNFAELRETKMAAILVENGFITNKNDAQLLRNNSFLQELTQATVEAFVELYDLKKKEEPGMTAKTYIVQSGDNMYRIARNNNMTLEELASYNPHITDINYIEVGDIVFLSKPTLFEVDYAAMNRELILCRKKKEEYEKIGKEINTLSHKFL
ncbi:MAG: LysM peptidoglycan-binding domain-containing protein [Firmicutes bacterium]|nr:LysM peptidoglycan-binding domain-containing protein [Bacillota bacterium]